MELYYLRSPLPVPEGRSLCSKFFCKSFHQPITVGRGATGNLSVFRREETRRSGRERSINPVTRGKAIADK
ncbi:hypothetical protein H6F96_13375 [Microcoleus sp. FACHB-53]|nr:hypothetical protein [Microcoleus sp. FACHB-53]